MSDSLYGSILCRLLDQHHPHMALERSAACSEAKEYIARKRSEQERAALAAENGVTDKLLAEYQQSVVSGMQ